MKQKWKMINFAEWSIESEEKVEVHKLCRLTVDTATQKKAIAVIAKAIPHYYTSSQRISDLFSQRLINHTLIAANLKSKNISK